MLIVKKFIFQNIIKGLKVAQAKELLLKVTMRNPGLIFDLLETRGAHGGQPGPGGAGGAGGAQESPEWCRCGNCRPMATELENLCCNLQPRNCISNAVVSS